MYSTIRSTGGRPTSSSGPSTSAAATPCFARIVLMCRKSSWIFEIRPSCERYSDDASRSTAKRASAGRCAGPRAPAGAGPRVARAASSSASTGVVWTSATFAVRSTTSRSARSLAARPGAPAAIAASRPPGISDRADAVQQEPHREAGERQHHDRRGDPAPDGGQEQRQRAAHRAGLLAHVVERAVAVRAAELPGQPQQSLAGLGLPRALLGVLELLAHRPSGRPAPARAGGPGRGPSPRPARPPRRRAWPSCSKMCVTRLAHRLPSA